MFQFSGKSRRSGMDPRMANSQKDRQTSDTPGRQVCSLDTRLSTSIFAASEAFVEKKATTSGVGKERKAAWNTSLQGNGNRTTQRKTEYIHGLPCVRFLGDEVQQIHG